MKDKDKSKKAPRRDPRKPSKSTLEREGFKPDPDVEGGHE